MTDKPQILYGIHPVTESIRAGRRQIFRVFIASGKKSRRTDNITALAEKYRVPVDTVTVNKLEALCGNSVHQGVAAKTGPFAYANADDILENGDAFPSTLLLLDHIVDPQNLGAILRTAVCAGIQGIFIPKDRSAGATPAVSKASAGALEHARVCRVTNLVNTIKDLKKRGVWIYGLDRDGGSSIFSTDLSGAAGFVIGGEDTGVRPLVKKVCDAMVFIPQAEEVNSLNASAAAAVVMYEAFRQKTENLAP